MAQGSPLEPLSREILKMTRTLWLYAFFTTAGPFYRPVSARVYLSTGLEQELDDQETRESVR